MKLTERIRIQRPAFFTNLALVLLGTGIFQIVAALLAIFVWLAGADWRSLIPQILVIAFWISWVLAYILWLKYIKAKKGLPVHLRVFEQKGGNILKTISTQLTQANIDRVLALLSETPGRLKRLSAGLPEGRLQAPLGPGERSFVATLAHLLNVEARTADAIFAALLVDEPALLPIHAERDWGKLARYERLPFPDLLAYFNVRRVMLLGVLKGLDEREWGRTVQEAGKKRRESVYWKARGQALHELEHLEDLEIKLRG